MRVLSSSMHQKAKAVWEKGGFGVEVKAWTLGWASSVPDSRRMTETRLRRQPNHRASINVPSPSELENVIESMSAEIASA